MITTTRRINLLPRELEDRRRARQRKSGLIAAGAGVIALLLGAYAFQAIRLGGERNKLEEQQARNQALKTELSQLADFEKRDKELRSKLEIVDTLTADEVRWSVLLADISLVIPPEAWLTNFNASVQAAPGGKEVQLGAIQMNGSSFTHLDVAKWLTRLSEVDAFTVPYLTLSSKAEGQVSFNSSVLLSEKAFRNKQPGAQRQI